jgi:lipopolysaccharide/colanic/teichoic acid biosynthesis glycosyltransferase
MPANTDRMVQPSSTNTHSPIPARIVDCVLAGAGLIILSPVLCLISLIVWQGGLPVFFRQTRVGRNGKPFTLLKFRSMHPGSNGQCITASTDQRVSSIGKILRRYKLDELPQLWNVLKGDMSILGPRPEVSVFVDPQDPRWINVLSVRPGITGVASLLMRNEEQILARVCDREEYYSSVLLPLKLWLETTYLRERSFWTDIKVLVLTLRYSFFPIGFDSDQVYRSLFGSSSTKKELQEELSFRRPR